MKKINMTIEQHKIVADRINEARGLLVEAYIEIAKCHIPNNALSGVLVLENLIKSGGPFMRLQLNFSDWFLEQYNQPCKLYNMPLIYNLPELNQLKNQRKVRKTQWYDN